MLFSVAAAEPHPEAATHNRSQALARFALFLLNVLLLSLIIALISTGVWFLNKRDYLTPTYPLTVRVDNALGVTGGTPITYKGLQVGTVEKAVLDGDSVALKLKIRQQYHFNQDARFVVTPALFNIPAGLQIAQNGSSDSPEIPAGTTDLTGETMLDPVASLTEANRVFKRLESTADRTDRLLEETTQTASNINALMEDKGLRSNFKSTVSNVNQITQNSRQITGQFASTMQKVGPSSVSAINNMSATTADLRAATHESRGQIRGLLADAKKTTGAVSALAAPASGAEPLTAKAVAAMAKNVADTLGSLKSTADNLQQVTDRMNKASAATEKFVTDPAVQKSLGETLSGVKGITEKSNTLLEKLNQAPVPKK